MLPYLAWLAGVSDQQLKTSRLALLSFSQAKGKDVARIHHLPVHVMSIKFEQYSPPTCMLPPTRTLHKKLFEVGWTMMDVYKERVHQGQEAAARIRLLGP